MSIVLIIAQNLLNMNYFRAGVPSDTATHQIPIVALLYRYFFQRRECRYRHHYRTSVLQINLKLSSLGERKPFNLGLHIPISFFLIHSFYFFFAVIYNNILGIDEIFYVLFSSANIRRFFEITCLKAKIFIS